MSRITKLTIISVLFISLLFLVLYFPNLFFNGNEKAKNITVIAKMKSGDYWGTVKAGANAAAKEFDVNVEFIASDEEGDIDGQLRLVDEAMNKKMSALILAPNDYRVLEAATRELYDKNIPVIIMDSKFNSDKINCFIAADNRDAGKKAADELISISGKNLKVGIISFSKESDSDKEREKGLYDVFSQYPNVKVVAKEYCLPDPKHAYELTKKMITENKDIEGIVALNSVVSEGAADAVYKMNMDGIVKLIAFDSTPKEIDYMDKGVISATIIQEPFSMGYLSVKYAVNAMEHKDIPKYVNIDSKIIDGTNMYFPENQKFLFPFVK